MHGARDAPVLARLALRLVDRSGTGKYARHGFAKAGGGKAAERVVLTPGLLTRQQGVLACHRQARERLAAVDGARIDAFEDLGVSRPAAARMGDETGKGGKLLGFATRRVPDFQAVVVGGGGQLIHVWQGVSGRSHQASQRLRRR